jgi:hypothetical protein
MIDGVFRHQDSNGGGGLITDGDTPVDDRGGRSAAPSRRSRNADDPPALAQACRMAKIMPMA